MLTLPRTFMLADNTVTFTLTIDGESFTADVPGTRRTALDRRLTGRPRSGALLRDIWNRAQTLWEDRAQSRRDGQRLRSGREGQVEVLRADAGEVDGRLDRLAAGDAGR